MNKYLKYLIIIAIVFGLLALINYLFKPKTSVQIEDYLISKGFTKTEYENLFEKKEDNKKYLFSTADYTYMLNVDEELSKTNTSLNATYDFKTKMIDYSYRVNNTYNLNVYLKGNYDGTNFTCVKEFSNESLTNSERENLCSLAETNIKLFYLESGVLFEKYKFVDYIINKK